MPTTRQSHTLDFEQGTCTVTLEATGDILPIEESINEMLHLTLSRAARAMTRLWSRFNRPGSTTVALPPFSPRRRGTDYTCIITVTVNFEVNPQDVLYELIRLALQATTELMKYEHRFQPRQPALSVAL